MPATNISSTSTAALGRGCGEQVDVAKKSIQQHELNGFGKDTTNVLLYRERWMLCPVCPDTGLALEGALWACARCGGAFVRDAAPRVDGHRDRDGAVVAAGACPGHRRDGRAARSAAHGLAVEELGRPPSIA